MTKRKQAILMMLLVLLCCGIMAWVDGVLSPPYAIKSAVKVILFLTVPLLFSRFGTALDFRSLFRVNRQGMRLALCLAIPLYLLILGAYFLLKDVFDFSQVTTALTGNIGVNKENFVFVALYIAFVNSLLEEFFFRGFAYLSLTQVLSPKIASLFSAVVFALYHVAIMRGWFSIWVFGITMVGLFAGGLIFNVLNARHKSIYPSWFVHASANFAINTIGFILFGIL